MGFDVRGIKGRAIPVNQAGSIGLCLSQEAADISFLARIQASLNELMEQGNIEPPEKDIEAAERVVALTNRSMPQIPLEQIISQLRARFPQADQQTLTASAEVAYNRREARRTSENESTMNWPYKQIAIERLDNLGLQLVGTDPSKENEYKENCAELQEALRNQAMLGNITDKTYQAYSDRLREMIADMPKEIQLAVERQNVAQRLNELMPLGDIHPSTEELRKAEDEVRNYLASSYAAEDEEEREEDIANYRRSPYVVIAHGRLEPVMNSN